MSAQFRCRVLWALLGSLTKGANYQHLARSAHGAHVRLIVKTRQPLVEIASIENNARISVYSA